MVRGLHAIRSQSARPTGIGKATIEVIPPLSIEHAALPPEGALSRRRARRTHGQACSPRARCDIRLWSQLAQIGR